MSGEACTQPNRDKQAVRLFPRRKGGDSLAAAPEKGRQPVELHMQTVAARFALPQAEAAQELGISLTALKQVCRKLGICRWPYRRPKKRGARAAPATMPSVHAGVAEPSVDSATASAVAPVIPATTQGVCAVPAVRCLVDEEDERSEATDGECWSDSAGSDDSCSTAATVSPLAHHPTCAQSTAVAADCLTTYLPKATVAAGLIMAESAGPDAGMFEGEDDMNWLVPCEMGLAAAAVSEDKPFSSSLAQEDDAEVCAYSVRVCCLRRILERTGVMVVAPMHAHAHADRAVPVRRIWSRAGLHAFSLLRSCSNRLSGCCNIVPRIATILRLIWA